MPATIEDALAFSLKAHRGQKRKGSEIPYFFHPVEAAQIVLNESGEEDTVMAALLHDVLEDTEVTEEELAAAFNSRICELVSMESEDKTHGWERRKESAIRFVRESEDEQYLLLVMADKLSNLRAIRRDLKAHGSNLWTRFNMKNPKRHEWYYRQMGEAFSSLKHTDSYHEYMLILSKVFDEK